MQNRYSLGDPSNRRYGVWDTAGIRTPLVVESSPDYAVQLRGAQDGINAYKVGAVSVEAAGSISRVQRCSGATGHPVLCANTALAGENPLGLYAGSRSFKSLGF